MMNNLLHRITALSMALLMLLSSTGFFMDAHYCEDQLQGISFFGKAKSCHDKQEIPPCHKTKKTCQHQKDGITDKDNCCHNERIVIEKSELDATYQHIASVQDIQLDFVVAFVMVYHFTHSGESYDQSLKNYKPSLPDRDFQLLYQSYLI